MRKLIALILCLCVLVALVGCGAGQIEEYEDPDATANAEVEDTADADTEEAPGLLVSDGAQSFAAYDPDTVVATINGQDVTWEEYHYWLYYFVQYVQMLALQNGAVLSSWDAYELSADNTNAEVILLNAQDSVLQYHAMESLAEELGITLDADDEAELTAIFEEEADAYAGDGDGVCTEDEAAAFEDYLAEEFVSREFFDYMNSMGLLSEKAFMTLYGEMGEKYPDADILAFADEVGVVAAKHILLLTVDMTTGEALSDDEIAEKRALADDLYAQLAAVADDQEALNPLFDELMAQYTEDTGYESFPEGYTYVPGVMVTEFEDAVNALDAYGISEVVESDYGYHIIMRIPVSPDAIVMDTSGQSVDLRAAAADDAFYFQLMDAMDSADIVWGDGFENLNIAAVFGE